MYFVSETLSIILFPLTFEIILTSRHNATTSLPDIQHYLSLVYVLFRHIPSHEVRHAVVDVTLVDEVTVIYFANAMRVALEPLANVDPFWRHIVALAR